MGVESDAITTEHTMPIPVHPIDHGTLPRTLTLSKHFKKTYCIAYDQHIGPPGMPALLAAAVMAAAVQRKQALALGACPNSYGS
jgi:hypothetical protein